jgi:hypothetical protein
MGGVQMLGLFGVIFLVAGAAALALSTTPFGQIAGLVLWVIAALFLVGHATINAVAREARELRAALARALGQPEAGQLESKHAAPAPKPRRWFREG